MRCFKQYQVLIHVFSGEKVDTDVNVMPSFRREIISPQGLFEVFEKAKFMDENVQEAFVLNGSLSKESPDFIIMSLFDNPDEKYSFDNIMSDTISEQEEEPTNLVDSIVNEGSNNSDTTLTETEEMSSRKKEAHKKRKHKKHKRRSRRD